MRNYIILNGNNSNDITGLLIQSLPPISKPLMRTTIEEIDGRDGDIVTNLGYSAYDKEVSIGLYGSYNVDEVIKYFSDNSKGQVTFSNEPDKYYNYEIINQIDFERLIRFRTAIVTLHCQPFKYPTEETSVEINIQNITNEAEEMDLDNTSDAPMKLDLKGNTQQDGEPTPDSPVDINVVSGDNTIEICGDNRLSPTDEIDETIGNVKREGQNGVYTLSGTATSSGGSGVKYDLINTHTIQNGDYLHLCNGTTRNGNAALLLFDNNGTAIADYSFNANNRIINLSTYAGRILKSIGFYNNSSFTGSITFSPMILNNVSTTTEYEAYTGQSQLISLGVENLFDKDNALLDYRIGTSGENVSYSTSYISPFIKIEANTTYTKNSPLEDAYHRVAFYTTNNTNGYISRSENNTFTTPSNAVYLRFCGYITEIDEAQLEKGTKANSFTPYGTTPIELCKIEKQDHTIIAQDYFYPSNDKWYLHKEIGKYTFTGNESFSSVSEGYYMPFSGALATSPRTIICNNYTNYLTYSPFVASDYGISLLYSATQLYIRDKDISTGSALASKLASSGTYFYYILNTPTDTEITDTTLISQLNNLKNNVKSYDPITHITQNANNKPFILNATAVQKGTDTGIVNNDGNIYSKPTLDIEGNGIVAIYLNGNQMFSVDLSNSNECIIDVTNLEAYDPETNELMNRQVTGDYSKFILPVGENQVKVSGNVTKATITDYVRWL